MYKWWNLKKIVKERSQLHSLKCWILEAIRRFLNKKLEVKGIWTGGKCISSWAYEVGKIKKTLVLRDFSREFSVFWKIESLLHNFISSLCHSCSTGIWHDVHQWVILCLCNGYNLMEHGKICKKIACFFFLYNFLYNCSCKPPFDWGGKI